MIDNVVQYNMDIMTIWKSLVVQTFATENQHIDEWFHILIQRKELTGFEVERIPLKIVDMWTMKVADAIFLIMPQSQQVKELWIDVQDYLSETHWEKKMMLIMGSKIKIYIEVQEKRASEEWMEKRVNCFKALTGYVCSGTEC
jgi:hypothetical protein